ncbi:MULTISPECIES: hypothetical protein [unclassified Sphingomonas]|uniref:hypothetical protein n=1 Tax=unclassified Sphingomonas TaxID=196159 RepID=UPI0022B4D544|nr:hypothetical protein [Sphingomonas sp. NIBR02145]WHU03478.1 hypothetical protein O3305_02405 [Sphingomonas sp. NIBR02145]
MNHKLQLVAATLAGVLVTVAAGGIAMASMGRGPMGPFARADANGDGVVTRAEWVAAANARFDTFDTNHDGKLVIGEIPPAPRGHGRHHGPHGFDGPEDGPDDAAPAATPAQAQPGNAN